jgi:3-hydroxyisobutyrate dehydrogenase-like beta-hydroxyacid dehydrogenase
MRIGVIGIGNMGGAIARRLLRQGHEVVVWNRAIDRARALESAGAVVADSAAEVCMEDVVLSIVADDRANEELFLNGALSFGRDTIHVSSSTIGVELAERLTEMHRTKGGTHVGAPVLGRPAAAESGQLLLLAAGSEDAIGRCRPLFESIGQRTYVAGTEPWKAHFAKLAANFLLASTIEALAEVAGLLGRAGMDRKSFLELMSETAFACPVYKIYSDLIGNERYRPAGFRMPLGLKDVELVLAAAARLDAELPLAELVRDGLQQGLTEGYADLDWSALALVRAKRHDGSTSKPTD